MVKKKVTKKKPVKQASSAIPGLADLDKNISKAMKDMNVSLNISISGQMPTQKPKGKKK